MENFSIDNIQETIGEILVLYGFSLLSALIVLVLGWWVLKLIRNGFSKGLEKSNTDPSLQRFLTKLVDAILKVLLIITVISMLGVETTSFIAIIGAAGLAVGLALQGSLANFAGGVLILTFKPFKVGDFITANGISGTVREIGIIYTVLYTPQNQRITIPNGSLSNSSVTNFSAEDTRRLDMIFGIGYGDDIPKAKEIIQRVFESDERVLKDKGVVIGLAELGDSSVDFTVRVWCKSADFFVLMWDMNQKVKMTFDQEGVSIPFPQRDVHLFQEK
ncbi:MAG: mechanosensitive ion channel family protein [Chitinophagaceae bacterium]|nr:MAG: mechanosensitive ion channel family protein [Chitinophagaceae bacterium]